MKLTYSPPFKGGEYVNFMKMLPENRHLLGNRKINQKISNPKSQIPNRYTLPNRRLRC